MSEKYQNVFLRYYQRFRTKHISCTCLFTFDPKPLNSQVYGVAVHRTGIPRPNYVVKAESSSRLTKVHGSESVELVPEHLNFIGHLVAFVFRN